MRTHPSRTLRMLGSITATTGVMLTMLPTAAHAEPSPEPVSVPITVLVTDSSSSDPTEVALAGATLGLSVWGEDGPTTISAARAGADGSGVLEVLDPEDTSYLIEAGYAGYTSYGEDVLTRIEFNPMSSIPTTITIEHGYGIARGTVSATVTDADATTDAAGAEPVTDFTGAQLVVKSSGAEVQRIALDANGTFESRPLLTTEPAGSEDIASGGDYTLDLIPADGFALAEQQPGNGTAFTVPQAPTSPASVTVQPVFALVHTAPEPEPEPEPSPEPEPTPSPDPTPDPTPTPTPAPESPDLTGVAVRVDDASNPTDATDALNDMTSDQFDDLVEQTTAADGAVFLTNGSDQVLGLALSTDGANVSPYVALFHRPESGAQLTPYGLGAAQPTGQDQLAVLDLAAAIRAAQAAREQTLANPLTAMQDRNAGITRLNSAQNAVDAFADALPSEGCAANTAGCADALAKLMLAQAALRNAGLEAPATDMPLASPADIESAKHTANALIHQVRGEVDALTNSQHMDMLRLQSLTNTRNEASDLMDAFLTKTRDARTSIIGTMRSTPVSIGSVAWDRGRITGAFDLSRVPAGDHHLILEFTHLGATFISGVTVAPERETLAATGADATAPALAGLALILLGTLALAVRRRPARS